ncbi:MAG: ABC transporter permease subunit [bacterium]
MLALINTELVKIFSKWRTYIGFIVIVFLTGIVQTAMYFEGRHSVDMATRSFSDSFVILGNLVNGYFIANILLQTLYIHIPFLIVLVGGDLLAGEATQGTYRMLLTRPVSRLKIVTAKFLSGFVYTTLFMIFIFIISLGVSCLIFGTGELIILRDKVFIYAASDVLWRFICAYLFAILSMSTVISISIFFSSLVANAIGPIISTMAVIIIFIILSALNFDFIKLIHPYLFTNYLNDWKLFFDDPVDYWEVTKSASVLIAHIAVLYGVTSYIFIKKDILS